MVAHKQRRWFRCFSIALPDDPNTAGPDTGNVPRSVTRWRQTGNALHLPHPINRRSQTEPSLDGLGRFQAEVFAKAAAGELPARNALGQFGGQA